jgi:hypothetical protein
VTGESVVPSEVFAGQILETTYTVRANCGTIATPDLSLPSALTMWRWADTNGDGFLNVGDIQLIVLAIQEVFEFSTFVNDDIAGRTICEPQQVVNVGDILMAGRVNTIRTSAVSAHAQTLARRSSPF